MDALLSRRDAVGIMPTGAGKSLCYQIPALLFPGLTLVVSPPHLPDEGPGGGPGAKRHPGGVPQQLPDLPPVPGRPAQRQKRGVQDHLRGPRAPAHPGVSGLRPKRPHLHGHRGRGPLRLPVGPGLPPQLPDHPGVSGKAPQPAGGLRLYRHRHPQGPGGHPLPAGLTRPLCVRHQLRPAQPVLPGPAAQEQAPPAPLPAQGAPGPERHCLLRHPERGGGSLRRPAGAGLFRHPVPRGPLRRGAPGEPGGLPLRQGPP